MENKDLLNRLEEVLRELTEEELQEVQRKLDEMLKKRGE